MNVRNAVTSILALSVADMTITDLCVLASTHGRDADAMRELLTRGLKGCAAMAGTIAVHYEDGPKAKADQKGAERKAAEAGNRGLSMYVQFTRIAHASESQYTVTRKGDEFTATERAAKRARVVNTKEKNAKIPSAAETFAKAFRIHAGLAANSDLPTMLAMLATMPRGTVKTGKRTATARKAA